MLEEIQKTFSASLLLRANLAEIMMKPFARDLKSLVNFCQIYEKCEKYLLLEMGSSNCTLKTSLIFFFLETIMKVLIKDLGSSEKVYQTYQNCKKFNYLKWTYQIASLKIFKYPRVLHGYVRPRSDAELNSN